MPSINENLGIPDSRAHEIIKIFGGLSIERQPRSPSETIAMIGAMACLSDIEKLWMVHHIACVMQRLEDFAEQSGAYVLVLRNDS